jgi:glycosyltransferase involved in cell wall biosynthesis
VTEPLVAVDADVLGRRRTGDESYVENLLRELVALAPALRFAAISRDPERVPPGVEALTVRARSQFVRMGVRVPRLLRRVAPDLVHFSYVFPAWAPAPAVLTVHDLSFERHPELMSPRDRLLFRLLVPRSVRRAERVLTGSERTKRDLVERYAVSETKVVVTPYGVDPVFRPDGPAHSAPPFALFVGAIQPRKDPVTAVEALARLDADLELVFVGPEKRGGDALRAAITRLGLDRRVHFLGYVPTGQLASLYRGAECVVLPSRYEGFGLPVVEAMASGTPVVATNAGALPEIAGDAAVLVEPGDADAFAEGINVALNERERLVAAGLARAGRFTWADTARRTLAVYEELL